MTRHRMRVSVGVLSVVWSTCTWAASLTVIEDRGDTEPLVPYLEVFGDAPPESSNEIFNPALGAADLTHLLPIRSPELSPGPVARRVLNRPYSAPLFLVGADPMSRRWLKARGAELKKMGAIGLLVEVPDETSLRALIALGDGLTLVPASGSDLAAALGLTHYPVLITSDHLEQ